MSTETAPYGPKVVANALLDWAEELGAPVTPLKLQKLLYFLHADFLVATGKPLLGDEFEAWSPQEEA